MPKLVSVPEDLQGATRFNVEITDVKVVNDLFSKCFIKILYPGLNRNNVYIEKEVAEEMVKTLYNIPVVGEYIETIEDFKDHGGRIEITNDDIKFIQTTKPYGFVPEDTTVAWQSIKEEDGQIREYLTCTAYLWTGKYPEVKAVIEEGRPQSMELDEETLEGYWKQEGSKTIFHITKAQFSALCILGKDVPPAFESANIGSYYVANPISFSKRFSRLLSDYEAYKPGNNVVNFSSATDNKGEDNKEGGQNMYLQFKLDMDQDNIKYKLYDKLNPAQDDERVWNYSIASVKDGEMICVEESTNKAYKMNYTVENEEVKIEDGKEEITLVEYVENNTDNTDNTNEELEKAKSDYAELETKFNELKKEMPEADEIISLKEENQTLKDFKENVEKEEKEGIITKFTNILSENDINPFKEKLSEFSKDQLEEKLSVIAMRKVDFSKDNPISKLVPDSKQTTDVDDVDQILRKHNK